MSRLTAISLFAGVGGICLGFQNNGVDVIWANDIDKHACATYRKNFDTPIVEGPIEEIDAQDIPYGDLILFGFPCTSFSIAGYRKGFADEHKGHLFFEALRIIRANKPRAIFLENVRNLVSHDNGKTFQIIKDSLEDAGYYLKHKVMNSLDYGNIPQNRERIYVVGFKEKNLRDSFEFPSTIALTETIHDITKPHEKKPNKYYYHDTQYYDMLKKEMTNPDTVYQLRRVYVRENKSNVCPTLTANMGTGGHNVPLIIDDYGIRKLTPQECFAFQGFPEDYIVPIDDIAHCHLYKQAGNSVVVPVIDRIAKNIVKVMRKDIKYKRNRISANVAEQN